MDKVEKETQDFMNVESFSQLPFIRPTPPAATKEKGIRLFGIEFATADDSQSLDYTNASKDAAAKDSNITTTTNATTTAKNNDNGSESSRRFECHYCCRNFPTSQALGGHQNAHKRERQHAKREHLQSAMVHDAHHVYGLMNYTSPRLASSPHQYHHQHHHHQTYPSWNVSNSNPTTSAHHHHQHGRFYGSSGGSYGTQSAPINGSPLALWRIPTTTTTLQGTSSSIISGNPSFNRDCSMNLFSGGDDTRASGVVGGTSAAPHQGRYVYDSSMATVQDHVSLDLHL